MRLHPQSPDASLEQLKALAGSIKVNDVEKRDAIEEAVGDYDPEAARRGSRFLEGLVLGLGLGMVVGVFLDQVMRLVIR